MVLPAIASWLFLFGYQWAFALSYHGSGRTVFDYHSGVLGDGLILPALNVASLALLRSLAHAIPWRRLPLYVLLGAATALASFLLQAHWDLTNWSMPAPFLWSPVGQVHFFVLSGEMAFLYLALATAINNFSALRSLPHARLAFLAAWAGVILFAVSLAADYLPLASYAAHAASLVLR